MTQRNNKNDISIFHLLQHMHNNLFKICIHKESIKTVKKRNEIEEHESS